MNLLRLALRALLIGLLLLVHGLAFLGRWLWLLLRGAGEARRRLAPRALVQLLRHLGATYVKIGQFLSTRGDLLSARYLAALGQLQDRVGPFPFVAVHRILAEELEAPPEELFAELDPYPVASASVAQVHRGVLPDGRIVAVKVLRPGIARTVRLDLGIMRIIARLLALLPPCRLLDPVRAVEEFGRALEQQLDLTIEATNNRTFARCFAGDDSVRVPLLVDRLCTRRVLVMEFVSGVKILGPDWDAGQSQALARAGVHMLLRMIFVHGFVHADLHPGNLQVKNGRLVLLDLGLVARIEPPRRLALARLLTAWAAGDASAVSRIMLELVSAPLAGDPVADPAPAFTRGVEELMRRYQHLALARVQLGQVLLALVRLLRRQRLRLEASMTMVLIAIAVVEGVGRQLAPQLDLAAEALAFFGSWARPAEEARA